MATDVIFSEISETLKIPVMFLFYLGWFQNKSNKLLIYTTTYIIIVMSLFIIGTIQIFKIKNTSQFVLNLELIPPMIQLVGKVWVLAYYKKDLMNLLEDTHQLWDAGEQHKEAASKQKAYRKFVLNSQKVFLLICIIALVFAIISSFYRNSLILGVWLIGGYDSIYRFILIEEVICVIGTAIFLYSLACLYLGLCMEIIIQFKILSYNLRDLIVNVDGHIATEEECINKLTACIMHQQYIMRFIKKFKKIFSLILLFEYVTDAPILVVEMYAILERQNRLYKIISLDQEMYLFIRNQIIITKSTDLAVEPLIIVPLLFSSNIYRLMQQNQINSPATQIRCILVFMSLSVQLSFYCIPASYLSDEISNVANAAYSSNWETSMFRSLRTPLVLLIQNTQNGDIIKAGGLLTINAETVLNVLKVAWSLTSIMRGLK